MPELSHAVVNDNSTAVMLFYDILITFGEEVEHIWQKKFYMFYYAVVFGMSPNSHGRALTRMFIDCSLVHH